MGATLSRLGYTPLQQPCQKSHDCISHRLHQGWGPTLILGNEDAASPSIISLYTRLTALEKDLQISQEGNTNKEAIIQYLLNLSKGSLSTLDTETEKLKEQNSNLKKKIARMNEDSKRLKDKLRTALDIIFASSMQSVTAVGSQSVSSSCSNRCKSPSSEILIDLLGSCEGDASAVLSEEDTTLLNNDIHDDTLDVEGIKTEITPGQSLHESQNSLDSEFQDLPYIVHFADGDEEDKPKEGVEFITKQKVQVPPGTSSSVTPAQKSSNDVATLEESDSSSREDSLAPSRPNSTPTSCSSSVNGTTAPSIDGMKLLHGKFSQLATLTMGRDEDKSLDEPGALVSMMAQSLPSLNMYEQAEHVAPADTKARSVLGKVKSATEPRFTIKEIFSSSRERESAASIHRQSGGPTELRYPDLFKYDIHFTPPKSERDVYRTVIVSNLSPNISLGTLLAQVRGGMLIDAKLLDTVKITGKKSALITFLHEHAAMAFQDHAEDNPVVINGVAANVRVVSTPTWPIRIPLRKAIFDHHHTRCLMVYNFPWKLISNQRLRNDLAVCMEMNTDRLTHLKKREDDFLELHFSSVDWAGHAYGMLSTYKAYQDCTAYFTPDPCAWPLETPEGHLMASILAETVTESITAPDAESTAVDQSGRLAKVEWDKDSEVCRGRGFATRP